VHKIFKKCKRQKFKKICICL